MKNTTIAISKPRFGNVHPEDKKFGQDMLIKFLHTLDAQDEKPRALCFYTEGVKLTIEGSPFLSILKQLEQSGVKMVICKTCLNYYKIENQVQFGKVGGMDEILDHLSAGDKVINA